MKRRKVVYIAPSATRPWLVMKYAQALSDSGADVEVFFTPENVSGVEDGIVASQVPYRILPRNPNLPLVFRFDRWHHLRLPYPSLRLTSALLQSRADVIIAGQPGDLRIASWASRILRAKLVYMPFEYYPGLSYMEEMHPTYAAVERHHARYVDLWVALGDKLADLYRQNYDVKGEVIAVYSSVPRELDLAPRGLRRSLGVSADDVVVLYTGQISRSRGLWEIVEAMPGVPDHVHVAVIGDKDNRLLQEEVDRRGVGDRVHLRDFVPQRDLLGYTAEADIGIIPIRDICLSYRYCNPGKLFEYIGAGLPLIVSSLEQLRWFVETNGLGTVFTEGDPESAAEAITALAADRSRRDACAAAVRKIHAEQVCWEIQAKKMSDAVLA